MYRNNRSGPMQIRLSLLGVLMAGALVAAGCTAAPAPAPTGGQTSGTPDSTQTAPVDPRSKTVVYSHSGILDSIDPVNATFSETATMNQAMYDTLVAYSNQKELVNQLAESVEFAEDMRSIDITLKSGVKFHDGAPLTSKDVAYSLDRVKKIGTGVASRIRTYESTEIKDDTHFTIRLSEPDADAVGALTFIYVLNSELVKQHEGSDDAQSWLNLNEAGSGPYTLDGKSGITYSTTRFPGYWDFLEARPEKFMMRQVDKTSTLAAEIRAGNVDIGKIYNSDAGQLKERVDKGEIVLEKMKDGAQLYIYFNTSNGPTADLAVRKVVSLAYDYQAAANQIREGLAALATGPLPSSAGECRLITPEPQQDLAAAKKILEDAGLSGLELKLGYQPNRDINLQEATLLQSNLKEIGVSLELWPLQFPEYLQLLASFDTVPEMFLAADAPPFPGAGSLLNQSFLSTAVGSNRAAYSNPEFDRILLQANGTADPGERCELFKQAQEFLVEDLPAMPMYESEDLFAFRSDLGDTVYINPVGGTLDVKALRIGG